MGIKHGSRDVCNEVAIKHYGSATDENIEKIKNIEIGTTRGVSSKSPETRDEWFHNLCLEVASMSKCLSRKIGAVLVRDKSIISTGYNGPPRGVPMCDQRWYLDSRFVAKYGKGVVGHKKDKILGKCPRQVIGFKSGEGLDLCVAGHAERNTLINAARFGVSTKGYKHDPITLYMSCGVPCTPCLVEIVNAGVNEIVVTSMTPYDESGFYVLENSDLEIRLFDFLK